MQIQSFQLERYFARCEFNTRYLLSSSDCESLAVQELLGLAGEFFLPGRICLTGWPQMQGRLLFLPGRAANCLKIFAQPRWSRKG